MVWADKSVALTTRRDLADESICNALSYAVARHLLAQMDELAKGKSPDDILEYRFSVGLEEML
jgi:hypothetical protein